jgi:hypothetical protein
MNKYINEYIEKNSQVLIYNSKLIVLYKYYNILGLAIHIYLFKY